jgi:hypothetical protein
MPAPPRLRIPSPPAGWIADGDLAALPWQRLPAHPLCRNRDGGALEQPTSFRICANAQRLFLRFDCADRDAWSTYREHDDPLYEEEAVELFLAPQAGDPTTYYEIEVSPRGVVFDARIHNPTGRRIDLVAEVAWHCQGMLVEVGRGGANDDWWAALAIPWTALGADPPPPLWRANFYRIERPRDGEAEFSAWSATRTDPPDFHQPAAFGVLVLDDRRQDSSNRSTA